MSNHPLLVKLSGASYRIPGRQILKDLNFSLYEGSSTIILGANGSGKSTLLKCLAGVEKIEGEIESYYSNLGYVSHDCMLYPELTVSENLNFFSLLESVTKVDFEQEIERFNLRPIFNRTITGLSQGERLRVSLARALMGPKDFLVLDEPSSALDDKLVDAFIERIKQLRALNQTTIVYSTHDLARIKNLANQAIVINNQSAGLIFDDVDEAIAFYRNNNR